MEYEIDSEEALFDSSTNPSLRHTRQQPWKKARSPQPNSRFRPETQKGEVIPEEEVV